MNYDSEKPVVISNLQLGVYTWIHEAFGHEIANDPVERNHRFLEESLELVQSLGCTKSEAIQLVDYVFSRPKGEVQQEVGGVAITLAALCNVQRIDLQFAANIELQRIWEKIDLIRKKQKSKPKNSPLPGGQNADNY